MVERPRLPAASIRDVELPPRASGPNRPQRQREWLDDVKRASSAGRFSSCYCRFALVLQFKVIDLIKYTGSSGDCRYEFQNGLGIQLRIGAQQVVVSRTRHPDEARNEIMSTAQPREASSFDRVRLFDRRPPCPCNTSTLGRSLCL